MRPREQNRAAELLSILGVLLVCLLRFQEAHAPLSPPDPQDVRSDLERYAATFVPVAADLAELSRVRQFTDEVARARGHSLSARQMQVRFVVVPRMQEHAARLRAYAASTAAVRSINERAVAHLDRMRSYLQEYLKATAVGREWDRSGLEERELTQHGEALGRSLRQLLREHGLLGGEG